MEIDLENFPVDGGIIHTAYSSANGLAVTAISGKPSQAGLRGFLLDMRDVWPVKVSSSALSQFQGFAPETFKAA